MRATSSDDRECEAETETVGTAAQPIVLSLELSAVPHSATLAPTDCMNNSSTSFPSSSTLSYSI